MYREAGRGCPSGTELSEAELLDCIDPNPPVIAQRSCDWTYLAPYCECNSSSCRALGVEYAGEPSSQLLLRRVRQSLVGVFHDEIFLNARNLTVPLGQLRFERVAE